MYDAQSGVASNISLRVGRPARGLDRTEGGGATAYLLGRDDVLRHLCFERHVRGTRGSECRGRGASSIRSFETPPDLKKISRKNRSDKPSLGKQKQKARMSPRFRARTRRAGAAVRRSPWDSWRCSRRRTRRTWFGSGSPRCARRCGAWTARSEVRSRRERVGDAAHSPEGASKPWTDDVHPTRAVEERVTRSRGTSTTR